MQLQQLSAPRASRSHSQWSIKPIGRYLLPVFGIMFLAAATAGAAWLLLFVVDFGCRLFGAA